MIRQLRRSSRRAGPPLAVALALAIAGCSPEGTGSIKLTEKSNPAARPPAEPPASATAASAPSGRQLSTTDRLPRGNVKKKALENGRP
ncbi:MAG TPA: hypothetical protein VG406_10960 [Isosphaeraceae bacterium]|jgi:hypothetical protein|nr:hypothetical protein [Isosphaeraceae bacterium]